MSLLDSVHPRSPLSHDSDASVTTIKASKEEEEDSGHETKHAEQKGESHDLSSTMLDSSARSSAPSASQQGEEEGDRATSARTSSDSKSPRGEAAHIASTGNTGPLAEEQPLRSQQQHQKQKQTQKQQQTSQAETPEQRRKRVRSSTVHTIHTQEETTRASRFTLWETKTRFYLIAFNTAQSRFRVLKIDRSPGGQQGPAGSEQQNNSTAKDRDAQSSETRPAGMSTSSREPNLAHSRSTMQTPSSVTPGFWDLGVTADHAVYNRHQITELLDMVSEGNRSTGGLKEVGHFFGLVGFIRFTSTYYMVLMSRRSVVALLGGHYIYHCDETKILPVCHPSTLASVPGRTKAMDQEEARLLHTFKQVDLGKNFYFSYTYDLTRTLQENLTGRCRGSSVQEYRLGEKDAQRTAWGFCEKFIWNHHLLLPAFGATVHVKTDLSDSHESTSDEWIVPLCYGFVDQAKLSIMNRTILVTLIARRSRHFAGARFLKRGVNESGHVANDVETEQIVSDALTTAFYAPHVLKSKAPADNGQSSNDPSDHPRTSDSGRLATRKLAQNPRFSSYVMHRGSIPIYWTQDSTNMSPRPPIEISVVDPYYSAAALHFDDMFARYGAPIIILNLIKSKEKTPRETKLLSAFGECIGYLNQFLPGDKKMPYIAWDMSRASKSQDQDVIGVLEDIAEDTVNRTRFFHSGPEPTRFEFGLGSSGECSSAGARRTTISLQTGTMRVNCVDCLDRTNAAQFVVGKAAFGHQLHALGLLEHPSLPFDSDAVDMLTEMYHDLGDTIALQYGGSHLVNTMETYRKINQWTSHSRDMLEGLKRYYSNSFVDADKQAAINLFLGIERDAPNFIADGGTSDVGALISSRHSSNRRSYRNWFTPAHLEDVRPTANRLARLQSFVEQERSFFWAEYYRPRLFTDLMRHHAFKMTAVHQRSPQALTYPPNTGQGVSSAIANKDAQHQEKGASVTSLSRDPMSTSAIAFGRNRYESTASLSSLAMSSTLAGDSAFGPSPSIYSAGTNSRDSPTPVNVDASMVVTSPFISRVPESSGPASRPGKSRQSGVSHSHLRSVSVSSISSDGTVVSRLDRRGPVPISLESSSASSSGWSQNGAVAVEASPAPPPGSKALIGGVRRWMSLNQGGGHSTRKKSRRPSGRGQGEESSTAGGKADVSNTDKTSLMDPKASSPSIGGWTNPFCSLHVNPSHPHPASVLLENWATPAVAEEEAREYDLWLRQFKGNVQLESNLAEWDGILSVEAAALSSGLGSIYGGRRGTVIDGGGGGGGGGGGQGGLSGGVGAGVIPSGGWHSSDPNLSDADLQMYIQSVRRACLPAASLTYATSWDTVGPAAALTSGAVTGNLTPADEAVLKAYAAWETTARQMQPALRGVPEGKLKAYRGWANIGVGGR